MFIPPVRVMGAEKVREGASQKTHTYYNNIAFEPTRHSKVCRLCGGPADPAEVPLPPHADALVLVGEVLAVSSVEVVRLHRARGGTEEVLRAAVGRKVVKVARVLGSLLHNY